MRYPRFLAVSATALIAALSGTNVWAGGTLASHLADYNAAGVTVFGGRVLVPFNSHFVFDADGLLHESVVTITLPGNFRFGSVPILTASGGPTFTLQSGGVGSGNVAYRVSSADIPGGGTLTISGFDVEGATQLENPYGSPVLPITISLTDPIIGATDNIKAPFFASTPGALLEVLRAGGGGINLASNPPGTQFVPDQFSAAGAGAVATLVVHTELADPLNGGAAVMAATGGTNSLNPSDTVSLTVTGDFTGIASAYASPAIGACAATPPPGAYAGTVTDAMLSFSGVSIDTPVHICAIPDGVTLMQPNLKPYTFNYAFDATGAASAADFSNGVPQTVADSGFTYVGGTAQEVSNFFTGTDSGYATLLRVTNRGKGAATVVAEFQPFFGGNLLVGTLGSVAAGTGTVYTMAQLAAAIPGLSLTNSGQRAMLTVVGLGVNSKVTASTILVNPGGAIGNVD